MMEKKNRREIRCYDYVNHPYERVRDALLHDAVTIFQSLQNLPFPGRNRLPLNYVLTLGDRDQGRRQSLCQKYRRED
jgi:hypothetical protein